MFHEATRQKGLRSSHASPAGRHPGRAEPQGLRLLQVPGSPGRLLPRETARREAEGAGAQRAGQPPHRAAGAGTAARPSPAGPAAAPAGGPLHSSTGPTCAEHHPVQGGIRRPSRGRPGSGHRMGSGVADSLEELWQERNVWRGMPPEIQEDPSPRDRSLPQAEKSKSGGKGWSGEAPAAKVGYLPKASAPHGG